MIDHALSLGLALADEAGLRPEDVDVDVALDRMKTDPRWIPVANAFLTSIAQSQGLTRAQAEGLAHKALMADVVLEVADRDLAEVDKSIDAISALDAAVEALVDRVASGSDTPDDWSRCDRAHRRVRERIRSIRSARSRREPAEHIPAERSRDRRPRIRPAARPTSGASPGDAPDLKPSLRKARRVRLTAEKAGRMLTAEELAETDRIRLGALAEIDSYLAAGARDRVIDALRDIRRELRATLAVLDEALGGEVES